MIIVMPAIILNVCEFCKRTCPKKEAVAPNTINTKEKPSVNIINGNKLIFLFSNNSFNELPVIKEI